MKNIDSEIRARIESFVGEVTQLVRAAALDSVSAALGQESGVSVGRRGPGRLRKDASASSPLTARRNRRGGKRRPEDVQKTADALLAYVEANPGQGIEQIGKGMGVPTKELKLPVIKLVGAGSLRTEGQRRATKYFAGGGAKAKTAKKRGRKAVDHAAS